VNSREIEKILQIKKGFCNEPKETKIRNNYSISYCSVIDS